MGGYYVACQEKAQLATKTLGGDLRLCPIQIHSPSWTYLGSRSCCNVWQSGAYGHRYINNKLMSLTLICAIICCWLLLYFSRILWYPEQLSWSSRCHRFFFLAECGKNCSEVSPWLSLSGLHFWVVHHTPCLLSGSNQDFQEIKKKKKAQKVSWISNSSYKNNIFMS